MRYTLVNHSGYSVEGRLPWHLFVQVAQFEPTKASGCIPLVEQIERRGGYLFRTWADAKRAEEAENNPPKIPGLTPGALGEFDRSVLIPLDGQRHWRVPLYVPGVSQLRIEQAVTYALAGAEDIGIGPMLLQKMIEEKLHGVRKSLFSATLRDMLRRELIVERDHAYVLA